MHADVESYTSDPFAIEREIQFYNPYTHLQ